MWGESRSRIKAAASDNPRYSSLRWTSLDIRPCDGPPLIFVLAMANIVQCQGLSDSEVCAITTQPSAPRAEKGSLRGSSQVTSNVEHRKQLEIGRNRTGEQIMRSRRVTQTLPVHWKAGGAIEKRNEQNFSRNGGRWEREVGMGWGRRIPTLPASSRATAASRATAPQQLSG